MSTFIDIHVLQSVPPSCLNRDDTGSPKSAVYGGVPRARVSSQSWKRAVRLDFRDHVDPKEMGRRTKRVVEDLERAILSQADDLADSARDLAEKAFTEAGIKVTTPKSKKTDPEDGPSRPAESGYLLFLSAAQLDNLAETIIRIVREEGEGGLKAHKKDLKAILKQDNSIDIALFGRMVADDTDLNVDASCQVAHALSTHATAPEFDFFTAVDDAKDAAEGEDAGAGMMGTVEFNSSTLYRFATINVDGLHHNLGSADATIAAVRQFTQSFIRSMPTGKINTFANRTLPAVIVISLRDDQPVSWVGAFEEPVRKQDGGFIQPSVKKMMEHGADIDAAYGHGAVSQWATALAPYADAVSSVVPIAPLDSMLDGLMAEVAQLVSSESK